MYEILNLWCITQNRKKPPRRERGIYFGRTWICPQKSKTLDFIDFFGVASILALQHKKQRTPVGVLCFLLLGIVLPRLTSGGGKGLVAWALAAREEARASRNEQKEYCFANAKKDDYLRRWAMKNPLLRNQINPWYYKYQGFFCFFMRMNDFMPIFWMACCWLPTVS